MRRTRSFLCFALVLAMIPAASPLIAQASSPAQSATAPSAATAPAVAEAASLPAAAQARPALPPSEACAAAVASAESLMKEGKWKSAYEVLDAFDAKNADPYAVACKIKVCVSGYVQTSQHKAFALADLEEGQTLEALRAGDGEYEAFNFDPVVAADAILEASAGAVALPPVLSDALGDYYFAIQQLFSDNWDISDEEICTKSLQYYDDAASGGLSDSEGLMHRGELLLRFGEAEKAETFLRSALALDPENPEIHLNLGVSLSMGGKAGDASAEIDKALAGYTDAERRFNSYLVGARLLAEADAERSELYIKGAEAEFPLEPGPSLLRQMIAIELGKPEAADSAADFALDRFPDSPYVIRSLITTWINANGLEAAMAFLDRSIARMAGKEESLGVLYFYKSLLVAQSKGAEGVDEALGLLDSSEASFRKVYAEDNQVFQAIAQLKKQLAGAKAEAEAAAADAAAMDAAAAATPQADPSAPAAKP